MGEALIAGVVAGAEAGTSITVIEPSAERRQTLTAAYAVTATDDIAAVSGAELVVIAVKPDQVRAVCEAMSAHLSTGALVVSVAAGITSATLEDHLPASTPVVRVMPNTPAFVGQGVSAMSAGRHARSEHLDRAEAVLRHVGIVVRVAEDKQDAVTAVSGSGPAYVFYLVEAMIEAGVQLGLTRDLARTLAVQTALGAATLMSTSREHPVVLRENVMSPGGTTAAAIRQLEAHGVRGAVYAALDACAARSAELSG
jgi:pyrroline-5-carboxylate reductase